LHFAKHKSTFTGSEKKHGEATTLSLGYVFYSQNHLLKSLSLICAKFIASAGSSGNSPDAHFPSPYHLGAEASELASAKAEVIPADKAVI